MTPLNDKAVLDVEELSVRYRQREVLSEVSLTVSAGEVAVLLGANGTGKSTLLKSVVGVVPRQSGRILLRGQDVGSKETHELARLGVGYLMQSKGVFPNLSVLEHLRMATAAPGSAPLEEVTARIWQTFPALEACRDKPAGVLSGGERQMLAFSMLLARGTKLWLLDEPSGGLAPQLVRTLTDVIRRLSKELGTAVLLVEQNVKEALRIADKVYVLRNSVIAKEFRAGGECSSEEMERALFA